MAPLSGSIVTVREWDLVTNGRSGGVWGFMILPCSFHPRPAIYDTKGPNMGQT